MKDTTFIGIVLIGAIILFIISINTIQPSIPTCSFTIKQVYEDNQMLIYNQSFTIDKHPTLIINFSYYKDVTLISFPEGMAWKDYTRVED